MALRQSRLENLNIETNEGIFTPVYVYEEIKPIYENDEVVDYEYIGFEMKMTAEENYNEWLKNKDKPPVSEPTEIDQLRAEIDFGRMVRETQQSEIDYLKLMGGM